MARGASSLVLELFDWGLGGLFVDGFFVGEG